MTTQVIIAGNQDTATIITPPQPSQVIINKTDGETQVITTETSGQVFLAAPDNTPIILSESAPLGVFVSGEGPMGRPGEQGPQGAPGTVPHVLNGGNF